MRAFLVRFDDDSTAEALAGLLGDALKANGLEGLTAGLIAWPPPAFYGPYLLTSWTDEVRHASPCDCDEDNESVGERCMLNSDWTYAVCTVEGEWTPLFRKLPRHPDRGRDDSEIEAL